jgi:glucose/arabinose dehydrogenase
MRKFLAACVVVFLSAGAGPVAAQYDQMDYGAFLCATYVAPGGNVAYRGVAVPFEVRVPGAAALEGPIGGRIYSKESPVAGAADATIYQSNRTGLRGYRLNVPPGSYKVTLQFAELSDRSTKGKRIFDVLIQDKVVLEGLDVFDRVGKNKALDLTFDNVEVQSGQLVLRLNKIKGEPMLSGLIVEGKGTVRKINVGGDAYKDYAADWPGSFDAAADAGKAGVIFDTETLRYMAVWSGGFIKLDGVAFSGAHGTNLSPQGTILFSTKPTPGWAKAGDPSDPRDKYNGIAYGPLPRDWGRYKGLYRTDEGVVFKYTVGNCDVLDMPRVELAGNQRCFTRTLHVGPSDVPLTMVVTDVEGMTSAASSGGYVTMESDNKALVARAFGGPQGTVLEMINRSRILLKIPASKETSRIMVRLWTGAKADRPATFASLGVAPDVRDLTPLLKGGKARFAETVTTQGKLGDNKGAYTVDTITVPFQNPYKSWMRIGAIDFFVDGRAVVTTWSGDVWIVSGIDATLQQVTWKRIAAGLFQPLGVKVVNEQIYVLGRDGITRLHDTNGDGEIDFFECFNNDFLTTKNFHEFIFDLHTDPEGNFYFIKGGPVRPGGSGWEDITPSHGCLFKLSRDGQRLEVVARGFRAPNGMGVGPHGELTTGDNEGTWTPMCPINWIKPGRFYGVPDFSQREPRPTVRDNPLCWLPKKFKGDDADVDNSGGCQVWITGNRFGPLSGQLLHTSYGTCTLFVVLKEEVGGQMQGGVVPVPLKFDAGIMRARFVESQNALYLAGLRGWQTTATKDAGFYRVRYTGKPANLPIDMHVTPGTIKLTFTEPLDRKSAEDVDSYNLQRWNYRWTKNYGSPHFKVSSPKEQGHDDVDVESASLSADGKTVTLKVPELAPVMQMKIAYQLKAADGTKMASAIHSTINVVGDKAGEVHVGEYRIVQRK